MALSWNVIVERGKQHNKTVICEVEKRGRSRHRYFLIKCDICGLERETDVHTFFECSRCIHNLKNEQKKLDFILEAKIKNGDKFDYSFVEYINKYKKVKIKCNTCNKFFNQSPDSHLESYGCICNKRQFYKEKFLISCNDIHGDKFNYDLIEYNGMKSKLKILCNQCNKVFEQRASSHLNDRMGCPRCNESKGEIKVAKYLLEKNIKFIPQKTFSTLRNVKPLKCDFYLEDLNLLIEYDGEYHYRPLRGSTQEQKQKNLEYCQRRDKIKNEWARKNNIPLLRIPYWDFERIEELIDAFIIQHTRKKEVKQLVLEGI